MLNWAFSNILTLAGVSSDGYITLDEATETENETAERDRMKK
ncbi:hypothetical protein [Rhodococcus sp. JVH1]|nr:hypothetical protein [Rhodococcus sp. JVH1]EJI95739.1 hypothetical protein JVH1_6760 [Rhodococcus sp. JVH1]